MQCHWLGHDCSHDSLGGAFQSNSDFLIVQARQSLELSICIHCGRRAWQSLGAPAQEVQLRFTLPTGQSFRWRPTGPGEFTGVVGSRVVSRMTYMAWVACAAIQRDYNAGLQCRSQM